MSSLAGDLQRLVTEVRERAETALESRNPTSFADALEDIIRWTTGWEEVEPY